MRSFYGRSPVNSRAVCQTTAIRSRNFSVIACMGCNCVFHFTVNNGPINGDAFADYMTELVTYVRGVNSTPAYIIMDNAPIHKVRQVQEICGSQGSEVNLMFLPPYSPQLNPIEHLFSEWKAKVRRSAPKSEAELSAAIHSASETISSQHCSNYYTKMEGNVFKLIAGLPLDD